jgi:DNA-binding response OmpR family regulator
MSDTSAVVPRLVRFGVFEIDLRSGELRKSGARLNLQQQPLQVLSVLLEQPGELVTREELRKRLWPNDTFVDFDHGLNAAVKRLRDTLGDSADSPGSSRRCLDGATGSSPRRAWPMGQPRATGEPQDPGS